MFSNIFLNLYFIGALVIGYYSYKKIKTSKDYFIAGKTAGVFQVTGSLLATILGSSAVLGSVAFAYGSGWAGAWLLFSAALGLGILFFLIKYFKNFQGYNLPQLLETFYGTEVKTLSEIIIPIAWLGVIAAQIIGAGQIITSISNYSYEQGVIITGIIFIISTMIGGQSSVIKTDCFQLIFILFGLVACYFFSGSYILNFETLPLINEKFSYLNLLVLILTYSSTFVVGPDIYSRIFCARDEKTAKKSIIFSIIILVPLGIILAGIGIKASHLFPNVGSESPLLYLAKNSLSKPIQIILYFGLLSAVISSATTCLLSGGSIFAQVFTKNLENKNSIKLTRIFILIFGVISILIALKFKIILNILLMALSVYSGAFIIPTLFGFAKFKISKKFVLTGIIVGGVLALVGKIFGGKYGDYILILAFILNGIILLIGKNKFENKN